MARSFFVFALAALTAIACSAPPNDMLDAGLVDAGFEDAGTHDAGAVDAGNIISTPEQEPNDGAGTGELDSIGITDAKRGTIGKADDIDIFTVSLTAGQQLHWKLDSEGSSLSPHLTVSEAQNTVPVLVARGTVGGSVELDQLVLKSGTYAIIVRDGRNVPGSSSIHLGSAQHRYLLTGSINVRNPTAISVPSTTTKTLPGRFDSALFSFSLTNETNVTMQVKTPSSDLNSRLTLFFKTNNDWLGTNDDVSLTETDSRLTGKLAAGDYVIVVDNVSEEAAGLEFQLVVTTP